MCWCLSLFETFRTIYSSYCALSSTSLLACMCSSCVCVCECVECARVSGLTGTFLAHVLLIQLAKLLLHVRVLPVQHQKNQACTVCMQPPGDHVQIWGSSGRRGHGMLNPKPTTRVPYKKSALCSTIYTQTWLFWEIHGSSRACERYLFCLNLDVTGYCFLRQEPEFLGCCAVRFQKGTTELQETWIHSLRQQPDSLVVSTLSSV